MNGVVVTSQPERGFFFVRPAGGTRDDNHFAHINDWREVPAVGTQVEFDSQRSDRGLVAVPAVQQ
jgi:cold shock CspA family protein